MATKLTAGETWAPHCHRDDVSRHLTKAGWTHLQVRQHGAQLILESKETDLRARIKHARLRRLTKYLWTLDMTTRPGVWESTLLRQPLPKLLEFLCEEVPWVLAARD